MWREDLIWIQLFLLHFFGGGGDKGGGLPVKIKERTRLGGNHVPDFQGKQKSLEFFFNVKVSLIKKEKKSVRTTLKMYLGHLCPAGSQP